MKLFVSILASTAGAAAILAASSVLVLGKYSSPDGPIAETREIALLGAAPSPASIETPTCSLPLP